MKVYVLLLWNWDGDSYLVDSFIDVKKSIKELMTALLSENGNLLKCYLPGDVIPNEDDGHYGSEGFYQIIEKEI